MNLPRITRISLMESERASPEARANALHASLRDTGRRRACPRGLKSTRADSVRDYDRPLGEDEPEDGMRVWQRYDYKEGLGFRYEKC